MLLSLLEKALEIALKAHHGQRDKNGQPYIFHPIRVMMQFKNPKMQIVALLHDVLEDSEVTIEDLQKAGFDQEIIQAVICLTKEPSEKYLDYIQKVNKNPLARQVKLADIKDNLDLNRLTTISQKDYARIERYLQAKKILLNS